MLDQFGAVVHPAKHLRPIGPEDMIHWLGLAHQDMGDDERGADRIGPAVALQVGELCNQQGAAMMTSGSVRMKYSCFNPRAMPSVSTLQSVSMRTATCSTSRQSRRRTATIVAAMTNHSRKIVGRGEDASTKVRRATTPAMASNKNSRRLGLSNEPVASCGSEPIANVNICSSGWKTMATSFG